jgi:hypothetical protein
MTLRTWLPTITLLLSGACATTPASTAKTESSAAAIRAAEEVGGSKTPDAALHLQLAKEQFEHARSLNTPDEKDRAERLRMRAQADAELSLALARTESERSEAVAAISKLNALKTTAPQ